jgi:hypothetical protein
VNRSTRAALAAVLCALALSGCATTWSADPAPVATLKPVDEQSALSDALGAPTWVIFDSQVVADWTSLTTTANNACLATMTTGPDQPSFTTEFNTTSVHYNQAQATLATAKGAVKAGYPAKAPVLMQTQVGSSNWCAVPELLKQARG